MATERRAGRSSSRRYSEVEKAQAVRLVRALRAEVGTDRGTVRRVADQLGFGVESVRKWVLQADVDDGRAAGVTIVLSQLSCSVLGGFSLSVRVAVAGADVG